MTVQQGDTTPLGAGVFYASIMLTVLVLAAVFITEKELGISRQTVFSIERGRFDATLPLVFQLADGFGCRVDELLDPH